MTSKGKAKELVEKFYKKVFVGDFSPSREESEQRLRAAKQCALIAVDEILEASPSLPILSDNGTYGSDIQESTKYWQKVKQEINIL